MQVFLASDVIYAGRFKPSLAEVLEDQDITGVTVPASAFIPDIEWLQPEPCGRRHQPASAPASRATTRPPAGSTGTASWACPSAAWRWCPGDSATVPLAGDLTFEVQVANQGDSTETDVDVQGDASARATTPRDLEGTIDTIAAGETKSVSIPLDERPPPARTCRSRWRSSRCRARRRPTTTRRPTA